MDQFQGAAQAIQEKQQAALNQVKATPARSLPLGIYERVQVALREADRANERASVAAEIGYLVERNPEVARLLDLLNRF